MTNTEAPSITSMRTVLTVMSKTARTHAEATQTRNKGIHRTLTCPAASNWNWVSKRDAKWVKPVTPAMPMNMYAQSRLQPDMPPIFGPKPLMVYSYMLPDDVDRLANWFRPSATNRSMMAPKRKQNQPMLPAVPNINGTMRQAVMLGEIKATDWAVISQKFSALCLSFMCVCLTLTAWSVLIAGS